MTGNIASLDAPALKSAKIGVQLIGDDYSNSPPVHVLSQLGLANNLVGYSVYGDYSKDSPPADVVRAVENGDVDVAIAWGPMAGYFAKKSHVPLSLAPVPPLADQSMWRMSFAMSMAVHKGDEKLLRELNHVIETQQPQITRLLAAFQVPQQPLAAATAAQEHR